MNVIDVKVPWLQSLHNSGRPLKSKSLLTFLHCCTDVSRKANRVSFQGNAGKNVYEGHVDTHSSNLVDWSDWSNEGGFIEFASREFASVTVRKTKSE